MADKGTELSKKMTQLWNQIQKEQAKQNPDIDKLEQLEREYERAKNELARKNK